MNATEFPKIPCSTIEFPFASPTNNNVTSEELTAIITKATCQILSAENPLFKTCELNPHWEACQQKSNEWVKHWKIASERDQKKYAGAKFSRLMAGAHPNASQEDLETILLLVTFLFVYDDQNEGMPAENVKNHNLEFAKILLGQKSDPKSYRIVQAFEDVLQRIKTKMPVNWFQRFAEHFKQHFESNVWEASNRDYDQIPGLQEYLENRQNTGAVKVVLDLIELADGIKFDNAEFVLFDDLIRSANLIICLANDIFGTHREYNKRENYIHNIVCVLENHDLEIKQSPNSLEKAAAKAVLIHNEYVEKFIAEEKRLLGWHSLDKRVQIFIQGVKYWIFSHYIWSIETKRCLGKTLTVQLTPSTHSIPTPTTKTKL